MTKLVILTLLAVIAVATARGINGEDRKIKNNEIVPIDKESRVLLEVPLIGSVIFKSLKAVWYLLSSICSLIDYKLAAVALAVNVGFYLFSSSLPIVVGAVVVLGFCKLTGLCSLGYALDKAEDTLSYAVDHLRMGALKFENSF